MPTQTDARVLIVGAGLAGLCCARTLLDAGASCLVLEATDGVGGRVRTDTVAGFQLDRGFQILLTAYPEAQAVLDYDALALARFVPGALVRYRGRFHRVADPWRVPGAALGSLFGPIGTLRDKLRVLALRHALGSLTVDALLQRPETTTRAALRDWGFSDTIVARFFRPLFGGICLDLTLETSSRMFEFVFQMLARGDSAIPARGIGSIPQQIASRLAADSVRLGARVVTTTPDGVGLQSGERLAARAVVIATEGPEAARLTGTLPAPRSRAQTVLYFDMPHPPIDGPWLVLDGEGRGPVTNFCVPSLVTPSYAPAGRHLGAAVIIGDPPMDDTSLERDVRAQLRVWFGAAVDAWRHLRTYRVLHAQPAQPAGALAPAARPVRLSSGLFVCGDHRDTASIHGAMLSGRRAGEAVLEELGKPRDLRR